MPQLSSSTLVLDAAERHGVAGTVAGEANWERAIVGGDPDPVTRSAIAYVEIP